MKWEEVKTPKQLLQYMSENIKYGFVDNQGNIYRTQDQEYFQNMHREKWRLSSPERLRKVKYGECLDVVELERDWFLQNGYSVKTFYIWFEFPFTNSYSIHTYLVYQENNKYYYFEYADALHRGIYSFNSLEELLKYQKQNHIESNKKRNPLGEEELKHIPIYEYEKPNYECTYSEFIDFILERGSEVLCI